MTGIPAIPASVPQIFVSDLAGGMPKPSIASGVTDAVAHLRQESLMNADMTGKFGARAPTDPVAEARAALQPGPASHQPVSAAEQTAQTFDMLSQMTWRMVTFEVGNASLQKTDKSIKMFIQAQ